MFEIRPEGNAAVSLWLDGRLLLRHSPEAPALFCGRGCENIRMYRGNFDIRDRIDERLALRLTSTEGGCLHFSHPDLAGELCL